MGCNAAKKKPSRIKPIKPIKPTNPYIYIYIYIVNYLRDIDI